MNDELNTVDEDEVVTAIREGLAPVRMRTGSAAILAAGRSRQRRRGLSALAVAAVAVASGTALALPGAGHAPPAPDATGGSRVDLAAFTVTTNQNRTVTVSVDTALLLDPAALQAALNRAGVPAQVRLNQWCAGTGPNVPFASPLITAHRVSAGGRVLTWVISPAAIPAGAIVMIDVISRDGRLGALVWTVVRLPLTGCGGPPPLREATPGAPGHP